MSDERNLSHPAGAALDATSLKVAEAAAALESLREPAERVASSIEEAFGRAGASLAGSLSRAAADGEVTLAELARAVLTAVNTGLGSGGTSASTGGLGAAVAQVVGGLFGGGFGGARAEGGAVTPGAAYLVGERGPEVFRPASAGMIESGNASGAGGPVTVNLSLNGGPQALLRSEAQIAQMLARAVALGARRL